MLNTSKKTSLTYSLLGTTSRSYRKRLEACINPNSFRCFKSITLAINNEAYSNINNKKVRRKVMKPSQASQLIVASILVRLALKDLYAATINFKVPISGKQ